MVEVALRTGSRGRFEVSLDDKLLFSKAKLNRSPKAGEIVGLVQPVLGAPIHWGETMPPSGVTLPKTSCTTSLAAVPRVESIEAGTR